MEKLRLEERLVEHEQFNEELKDDDDDDDDDDDSDGNESKTNETAENDPINVTEYGPRDNLVGIARVAKQIIDSGETAKVNENVQYELSEQFLNVDTMSDEELELDIFNESQTGDLSKSNSKQEIDIEHDSNDQELQSSTNNEHTDNIPSHLWRDPDIRIEQMDLTKAHFDLITFSNMFNKTEQLIVAKSSWRNIGEVIKNCLKKHGWKCGAQKYCNRMKILGSNNQNLSSNQSINQVLGRIDHRDIAAIFTSVGGM